MAEPIVVKAGEAFIAVPERHSVAKMLRTATAVAGLLALVGYVGGLTLGGNGFAAWCAVSAHGCGGLAQALGIASLVI